jgi:3-deoxy-D-manno-octulosonic-acid transferase
LADTAIYLPLDSRQNAHRLFDLIQPSILIFSKFDIWPNLVWEAKRRKIPVALIAGTLQPNSKRLQPVARAFFRSVHQEIDLHCVISEQDAVRFKQLCPPAARIEVTGDTRFDRVYNQALVVPEDEAFLPGQSTLSAPVVVAGSTYTEEEVILIESLNQMTTVSPHLIIVPHEPTPVHVQQLMERLRKSGLTYVKYSELVEESNLSQVRVIIIDTIGILAKLYRMADVTFVGGSFHGSVHNVMEPAAMEKPILFGPTIDNAHEAHQLVQCGGAEIVNSANQLVDVLGRWLVSPQQRQQVARSALQVIQDNLGATERTLDHLQPYFSI